MIGFIVFGLVVGAVARLLVPGRQHLSIWMTLLLGVIGSVIGGMVANGLGTGHIFELNMLGSVVAVISAAVLGRARRWRKRPPITRLTLVGSQSLVPSANLLVSTFAGLSEDGRPGSWATARGARNASPLL